MADGELLSVKEAKDYLVVEHDDDDTLIGQLIAEAEARMESYIGTPVSETEYTEYHDGGLKNLFLEHMPIKADSVTITDTKATSEDATDDEVVDAEKYRIRHYHGMITRTTTNGVDRRWDRGRKRFKVVYTAGLEHLTDWTTAQIELRGSIRDLVSDWYERRIPTATRQDQGFGIATSFVGFRGTDLPTLPTRVLEVWHRYRMVAPY